MKIDPIQIKRLNAPIGSSENQKIRKSEVYRTARVQNTESFYPSRFASSKTNLYFDQKLQINYQASWPE